MHYLLVADCRGEHVLFKGTREALEGIAAKMRRELPALRIRIADDAGAAPRSDAAPRSGHGTQNVKADGWAPCSG